MIAQLKNCTVCGSRLNGSVAGLGSVCPSCIVRAVRTPCVSHADPVSEGVYTTTWADVFPQFSIERVLRKSDETPVYLARVEDEEPRKRVVIQIVTGKGLEKAGGAPALTVHARKLAAYSFDGLLPVLDFGDLSDAFFLVTEACDEPLLIDALAGADSDLSAELLAALDSCRQRLATETRQAGVELHSDPPLAFGGMDSGASAIHFTPSVLPAGSSAAEQTLPPPAAFTAEPDAKLGPFVFEEKLGEGGFGEVWRARQQQPAERQVALKILKQGLHSSRARARFDLEQAALARLDHPNIAHLYEAGTTSDGRPFFAMEWVDGTTLNRFWKDEKPPLDRRLELFAQVCRGVEHAHLKGILHRDLKPSNVMVATEGESASAKVIDFGIARALEEPDAEQTLLTRPFDLLGTPVYMSPEQIAASGEADARSDVYSLGMVLYEALCAQLPFDPKLPLPKLQRAILDDEPLRPSQRLADHAQARRIRGDLDWIALKCLEKDPARRYQSVGALLLDIERHTKNEPVEARPPSANYRLHKFARRHKTVLATTTAIAVLLVAGTTVSIWQGIRANDERDRAIEAQELADHRRVESEAISTFLTTMIDRATPDNPAGDDTTVTFAEALKEAEIRLAKDRAIPSERRVILQGAIEGFNRALGVRDEITLHKTVLRFYTETYGSESSKAVYTMRDLATALFDAGRRDEALSLRKQALDLNRKTHREAGTEENMLTMELFYRLEHSYDDAGRIADAIAILKQLVELQRKLFEPDHIKVRQGLYHLAERLTETDRHNEAISVYNELASLQEAQLTAKTAVVGKENKEALIEMNNLVAIYQAAGSHEKAIKLLAEMIPLEQKVSGPRHDNVRRISRWLADSYRAVGRPAKAESFDDRRCLVTAKSPSVTATLVQPSSEWSWFHPLDGVDPVQAIPKFHRTFAAREFDDSTWLKGTDSDDPTGGFGYGDDELTGVDIGTPQSKEIGKSAYFRHRFTTDREYTNLELRCLCDDGLIVYLDGTEVARKNMMVGEDAYHLPAMWTVTDKDEADIFRLPLDATKLPPGEHVLAISVHNTEFPSSDLRIGSITLAEVEPTTKTAAE